MSTKIEWFVLFRILKTSTKSSLLVPLPVSKRLLPRTLMLNKSSASPSPRVPRYSAPLRNPSPLQSVEQYEPKEVARP